MRIIDLLEDRFDPYKHKAIFLAGPPGAGKSTIAQKVTPYASLKHLSIDDVAAIYSKKGLEQNKAYHDAWPTHAKRLQHHQNQGKGIIVDGTGRNVERIAELKATLERNGYSCMMVFVGASLETAMNRNRTRNRKSNEEYLYSAWQESMANIRKLHGLFDDFIYINNEETPQDLAKYEKYVRYFLSQRSRKAA